MESIDLNGYISQIRYFVKGKMFTILQIMEVIVRS